MLVPGNNETARQNKTEQEDNVISEGNEGKKENKSKLNKEKWKRVTNNSKKSLLRTVQKRDIPNCRCKCSTKITREEQKTIFDNYEPKFAQRTKPLS